MRSTGPADPTPEDAPGPVPGEAMGARRRLAYALGSAGYQITDRIVVAIAVYFYLPPPGRGLENQVSSRVFFGFLTAYGVAMLVGRVFDSLADPIVGHLSDRSQSRFGRRRLFLAAGLLPMVGTPVLLFWPPGAPGSAANAVWLTALLCVYFVAFTVYVAPYLALIPEVARSEGERVRLARWLALVSLPIGVGFGTLWTVGFTAGQAAGLSPMGAIRIVVVAASGLALVLCVAPIVAIDERRFTRTRPADLPLRAAIGRTLANRPFRIYLAAQLAMLFGVNLVQPALPYLATVVLGRDEAFAAVLGAVILAGMLASLPFADVGVRRFGARRAMLASLTSFGVAALALGALWPAAPGEPRDALNLAVAFAVCAGLGPPVAGLLVVPHVLLSELVDRDAWRTGAHRAAMYFGVQGFLTKWVYGLSLAVLTFLLARFGNAPESPLGVILLGPVAGAGCLLAALLFARYPAGAAQRRGAASECRRTSETGH